MGAWGPRSFENDDALDWLRELTAARDLTPIETALEPAELDDYYLEAPEGARLVAALEVLAAVKGHGSADLPTEAREWVAKRGGDVPGSMVQTGLRQLERLQAPDSELDELWGESEHHQEWKAHLSQLERRLRDSVGLGAMDRPKQ